MELTFNHRFQAPRAVLVEALASPAYAAHLAHHHSFFEQIALLEHVDHEDSWRRRMHYRARPFIARLGMFSLPAEWFTWVEHASYQGHTLTFENVPVLPSVRDKVVNRGQMYFREQAGETVREARFEIEFRVPSMYRRFADMALAMVRRQLAGSLDEEAALLASWLSRAGAVAA